MPSGNLQVSTNDSINILSPHGCRSIFGGLATSHLTQHGQEVINPALDGGDFDQAVRTAQAESDRHHPDVIVGSSRGGAVAMNIDSNSTRWSCSARRGRIGERPRRSGRTR